MQWPQPAMWDFLSAPKTVKKNHRHLKTPHSLLSACACICSLPSKVRSSWFWFKQEEWQLNRCSTPPHNHATTVHAQTRRHAQSPLPAVLKQTPPAVAHPHMPCSQPMRACAHAPVRRSSACAAAWCLRDTQQAGQWWRRSRQKPSWPSAARLGSERPYLWGAGPAKRRGRPLHAWMVGRVVRQGSPDGSISGWEAAAATSCQWAQRRRACEQKAHGWGSGAVKCDQELGGARTPLKWKAWSLCMLCML